MAADLYHEPASYTTELMRQVYSSSGADAGGYSSFLRLAAIHGKLRKIPGIWSVMLLDILLHTANKTLVGIASQLDLSDRTLRRLLNGSTATPSLKASYAIFLLHI